MRSQERGGEPGGCKKADDRSGGLHSLRIRISLNGHKARTHVLTPAALVLLVA